MTKMRQYEPTEKPFTGRHMLAIMLAFFGVVISANVTMAWLAESSWTGLVVKNGYVASQKFNDELRNAREQVARGWKSSLEYEAGRVTFRLVDRYGEPIVLDDLRLKIGRPAFEQQDVVLPLPHKGQGYYELYRLLAPGSWSLRIEGGAGNRAYRRDSRLFVRSANGGSNG